MLGKMGVQELVIIFAIFLLIFGPKKLPQLGEAIGKSVGNFKHSLKKASKGTETGADSSISETSKE